MLTYNSFAQSSNIGKIIDSLKQKKISTLIHYYRKCDYPTLGNFNEYLLWSQNSVTKLITYTSQAYSETKDQYTSKELKDDSIFLYLNKHIDSIKKERILPFIYVTQVAGTPVYLPMEYTHPCTLHFNITFKEIPIWIVNGIEDFEQTFLGDDLNLNYKFNSSTHSFQLIKMIQKEIQ